jgi:hypothetical protein
MYAKKENTPPSLDDSSIAAAVNEVLESSTSSGLEKSSCATSISGMNEVVKSLTSPSLEHATSMTDMMEFLKSSTSGATSNNVDDALSKTPTQQNLAAITASHGTTQLQPSMAAAAAAAGVGNNIAPLPGTSRIQTSSSFPGAFAMSPQGVATESEGFQVEEIDSEHDPAPTFQPLVDQPDMAGLAVASLVDDTTLTLPIASPHTNDSDQDREDTRKRRLESSNRTKRFNRVVLLAVILLIAIFVSIAVFLARSNESSNTKATDSPDSSSPSGSPTTLSADVYLVSLLSEETALAIVESSDSPQAKAFQWLIEDFEQQGVGNTTEEQIRQRFILATLYFATDGDNWEYNENWLNHSAHECVWYNQPEFAKTELMTALYPTSYLPNFFPRDQPLPSTCNHLDSYQHLWLDQNKLKGTLPNELYMLTSLETLSIMLNPLEGGLSTYVGMLTSLRGLMSSSTWFLSPSSIPSELGLLTNLHILGLHGNSLHGSVPSELWQLTHLEHLNLGGNHDLTGTIPTVLGMMSNLTWLTMHEMDLSGTLPTEIGNIRGLRSLALFQNKITGTILSELGLLSELQMLSLDDNAFEGTIPTEIVSLSSLMWAWFFNNQLTGPIPSELGLLTNLTMILSLRNNHFTGSIPSQLGLLTDLQVLELEGNNLSGIIPTEFGRLKSMGRMTFANNSLSGTVPLELSALQHTLYTLSLEGNPRLLGTVPQALCAINNTCRKIPHDFCEGAYGTTSDCSGLLCGCSCSFCG